MIREHHTEGESPFIEEFNDLLVGRFGLNSIDFAPTGDFDALLEPRIISRLK